MGPDRTCVQRRTPGVVCVFDAAGSPAMLDILYILIGAAFLGGCVLYAIACERL